MVYYYSPLRKEYQPETLQTCSFCDPSIERQGFKQPDGTLIGNAHYLWVANYYPKFEGHTMLIPRRHLLLLEDETSEEVQARHELLCYASKILKQAYGSGIEIFLQTGDGSAASIKHLHWHVLPASSDDPLRGFEKLGKFTTTEEGKEKIILFPMKIKYAREGLQLLLNEHVARNPF